MSKFKEALEELRQISASERQNELYDVIQEVVDKETPVKPIAYSDCPVCGTRAFEETKSGKEVMYKYCAECGVKLDWEKTVVSKADAKLLELGLKKVESPVFSDLIEYQSLAGGLGLSLTFDMTHKLWHANGTISVPMQKAINEKLKELGWIEKVDVTAGLVNMFLEKNLIPGDEYVNIMLRTINDVLDAILED